MADNIRQFKAPELGLQPTEIGVEATAAAARRGGAFFHEAAQDVSATGQRYGSAIRDAGQVAVDSETHREVSVGQKDLAARINNLTEEWNSTVKNADPNDPSVAAKFREERLEPELESFTGNFHTEKAQQWAQAHTASWRQHMFEKTTADMATMAGQAARVNLQQSINFLSNTALNDPSSLDFSLKTFEGSTSALIDSSPNLKGAAASALKAELTEKGREQIVKSAALGYINKTAQVPEWASDPKYSKYINGTELRMFQKNAEAQQKANLYYERQAATLEKQQADLKVHQDAGNLFTNNVVVDPNNPNRVLVQPGFVQGALDIARKNPTAPSAAATAKAYIDWAESQTRQRAEPVISDAATKSSLYVNMFNPDKPTTEVDILKAEATDKLSTRDGNILRQIVKATGPEALHDPLVHTAIQAASERVGVGLVGDGHERYANFMQSFWPQYLAAKRSPAGVPANALDLKDPNSLISQSLKAYEPPAAERMMMHILKQQGISSLDQLPKAGTAAPGAKFTPPGTWSFRDTVDGRQYRDPAGNLYNKDGKPIARTPDNRPAPDNRPTVPMSR